MKIFTKVTIYILTLASVLLILGTVLYLLSFTAIENQDVLEGISVLLAEVACIVGIAGVMTSILSLDEN